MAYPEWVSSLSADRAERGFEAIDDDQCRAFQSHVELLGRRWNSAIMLASMRGAERFSEYRALVLGISDRLLALRLRELETEGLITRTVLPTTPVSIRYHPTERGRELMRVMQPLIHWALDDERPQLRAVEPTRPVEPAQAAYLR